LTERVKVAVLKTQNYKDTYDAVKDAVKLAGGLDDAIKKDSFVTLKPNLVRLPKKPIIKGMATNFETLEAVIKLVREKTSRVAVIESDTMLGTAEDAFEKYDTYALVEKYGLELINSSKEKLIECTIPDPQFYVATNGLKWLDPSDREMYAKDYVLRLPEKLLKSVRISIPTMKTQADPYSALTFSIKNMFGVLPEVKKFKKFHERKFWKGEPYDVGINVARSLLDICQIAPPNYAIIDGLWGLHGPGSPATGYSVELGLIIASQDAWAADTVAGEIVGFDMKRLFYFEKAERMGLGTVNLEDIEIVGEELEKIKYPFKLDVSLEGHRKLDEAVGR
jgi:uncharacterized protein (DUF362 family)